MVSELKVAADPRAADARVVRTRDALRVAMTELASELPLDSITVRAIAARADVGYATFFRHYPDKEALLADVADKLIREFQALSEEPPSAESETSEDGEERVANAEQPEAS